MMDIGSALLALVVFVAWSMTLVAIPTLPVIIGWLTAFVWACDAWRHVDLKFEGDGTDGLD